MGVALDELDGCLVIGTWVWFLWVGYSVTLEGAVFGGWFCLPSYVVY